MAFSKGVASNAEIIALPEAGLDADLQELQGTIRHIVAQLERLKAEDALLIKYGVEKRFLGQLERLAQEDLSGIDNEELERWRQEADAAVEKLFPLLQEAREIHQVKQDRIKNLRERHNLHEVERLDELVLELLPPSVSIEKRLGIRKKRDVLKKGTRLSKEYRAAMDSTNAPAFCEFESEDGERMGGVSKESLREGALAFVVDSYGLLRLSSKIVDPSTGEYTWKEFDYNRINKNTKEGAEVIEGINEWIGFLTGEMLQDAVKNLLSKEAGVPPEKIPYDNTAANARVGILPGESTIREVAQSWIDMLLDFEVVPMTVMRPEEDGTDVASVQENVTYHERVDDEHSPRIAHQLMSIETDWFFDEPPARWGAILEAQDPEVSIQGDLDWASKDSCTLSHACRSLSVSHGGFRRY